VIRALALVAAVAALAAAPREAEALTAPVGSTKGSAVQLTLPEVDDEVLAR
jgi:hypothetical protein